jgi:hypothetical protein
MLPGEIGDKLLYPLSYTPHNVGSGKPARTRQKEERWESNPAEASARRLLDNPAPAARERASMARIITFVPPLPPHP